MFPRNHRLELRSKKDFFSQARKTYNNCLIWYVRNISPSSKSSSKAAVIVPRGALPLSSGRNQVKRWLRALILPYLDNISEVELAVVYRSYKGKCAGYEELYEEVRKFFSSLDHS